MWDCVRSVRATVSIGPPTPMPASIRRIPMWRPPGGARARVPIGNAAFARMVATGQMVARGKDKRQTSSHRDEPFLGRAAQPERLSPLPLGRAPRSAEGVPGPPIGDPPG